VPVGVACAAGTPNKAGITLSIPPMNIRQSAIAILTDWQAPDPAQDSLRHAVLAFVHGRADACRRECVPGHVTASALVLDDSGHRVLLTLHPRLGRWVQLGGHCDDDDDDIVAAALREAIEESGVADLRIAPELVAVHVHPVTCSLGVPTRHLDLQFVAHAPAGAQIAVSDESDDLRWWPADALPPGSDHALAYLVARATGSHVRRVSDPAVGNGDTRPHPSATQ
jgi:8-oxo-dGTP pyrophosphatase MutT (NUDIX family)